MNGRKLAEHSVLGTENVLERAGRHVSFLDYLGNRRAVIAALDEQANTGSEYSLFCSHARMCDSDTDPFLLCVIIGMCTNNNTNFAYLQAYLQKIALNCVFRAKKVKINSRSACAFR